MDTQRVLVRKTMQHKPTGRQCIQSGIIYIAAASEAEAWEAAQTWFDNPTQSLQPDDPRIFWESSLYDLADYEYVHGTFQLGDIDADNTFEAVYSHAMHQPVEHLVRDIFTGWHKDEVTGDSEARDYADGLIKRLKEAGIGFARLNAAGR